jgi:hypothetical protein
MQSSSNRRHGLVGHSGLVACRLFPWKKERWLWRLDCRDLRDIVGAIREVRGMEAPGDTERDLRERDMERVG